MVLDVTENLFEKEKRDIFLSAWKRKPRNFSGAKGKTARLDTKEATSKCQDAPPHISTKP